LKKSIVYALIALMLALGAAFVACGGGGNGDDDNSQPTVAEQQDDEDSEDSQDSQDSDEAGDEDAQDEEDSDSGGDSGGSFGDVPVYPGAKETFSGEWSGGEGIPGIGSELDTEDYQNVEYALYETDDDPEDVYDWYKDHMGDWDEQGTFSGGSGSDYGAYALWTKDDGKQAAWITVGGSDGTTTLGIWAASQ